MPLPAWAALDHPIVRRETLFWRRTVRRWRWVAIPLAILPCACGGMFALMSVPLALEAPSPGWAIAIVTGWVTLTLVWITNGLLGWALGTFVSIGAALMVAREREVHNWGLLRLTAIPIHEIIAAKAAALARLIFWPAVANLGLGVLSLVLTGSAMGAGVMLLGTSVPADFPPEVQISAIAMVLGALPVISAYTVIAMMIGLLYNCAVGLFTSTLTRTTANAVILSFAVHFGIYLLIFVPVQQLGSIAVQMLGGALTLATQSPVSFLVLVPAVSFVLPIVLQVAIGATAYVLALNQAQRIAE